MQVQARLRSLRMSPRKVRLVIGLVRGLPVSAAVQQLEFCPKEAARPVLKLLQSAIANAEHNHKLDSSTLRIVKITADGGAVLHRWKPRAHGRAAPIRKRTSHVQIILSDEPVAEVHASQKKGGKKPSKPVEKKPESKKSVKVAAEAPKVAHQDDKRKLAGKKPVEKNMAKKPVTRKPVGKKSTTNK